MKLIKILTIVFIVSFTVQSLYSQDAAGNIGNSVVTENQSKGGSGDTVHAPGKEASETVADNESTATVKKGVSEEAAKNTTAVKAKKKAGIATATEEVKAVADNTSSGDDFLLPINEGNFKYKRIPDIKLVEKTPSAAVQNNQEQNGASADSGNVNNTAGTGFFNISRNTAKIGILLFILGVFILYKVRSKSTTRRSSSSSVMNSYRK